MSQMDVERLMCDLTVEQLAKIQGSLSKEMENKREELRQMVGRRYRDVLEASNTMKRLTEVSGELIGILAEMRGVISARAPASTSERMKKNAVKRFVLLKALLPMVVAEDGEDELSAVFSLCLADGIHRSLSADFAAFHPNATQLAYSLSEELLRLRMQLFDQIVENLGAQTDLKCVTGKLVALALLKQLPIAQLFELYLDKRMETIVSMLGEASSTLVGVIRMIKETVQCVDEVFGTGNALLSTLQTVTSPGWCPSSVIQLAEDQPFGYSRILDAEVAKVNAGYNPAGGIVAIGQTEVQNGCSEWIVKMCSVASDRVRAMCDYFERVEQAVEFVVAINQLFKSDWSSTIAPSSLLIYRRLFGDALLVRFRQLIDHELAQLEADLLTRLPSTNCNPMPLFHKRATKFDALLASGVSHELNQLVQSMSDDLRRLLASVSKYTSVGQEEGIASLNDTLADAVLRLVERLANTSSDGPNATDAQSPSSSSHFPHQSRTHWLTRFRFLLALVQHEPSALCQCMNRDVDRIVRCNKILHAATENALCRFMDFVVDECELNSRLKAMPDACTKWHAWLDLVQEPEKVELSGGAARLEVPTQLSRHYFLFLFNVCREVNHHSLGHLFTRNVTAFVSKRIGEILSRSVRECAESCVSVPLVCAQLLFDCKALFLMFLNKDFLEAARLVEAKMEPIELKLVTETLSKNAKLFAQRSAMLFGQLQAEPISGQKEGQLSESYAALIDVMPKVADIHRLAQIPRLSKLKDKNEDLLKPAKQRKSSSKSPSRDPSALAAGASALGKQATQSFTSLYDKISVGWFKNN